eukprot:36649-Prymnesium_polylepis.2
MVDKRRHELRDLHVDRRGHPQRAELRCAVQECGAAQRPNLDAMHCAMKTISKIVYGRWPMVAPGGGVGCVSEVVNEGR